MNKLFKVIWSKSKQCYIVVSEVAKNTTGKKKIAVGTRAEAGMQSSIAIGRLSRAVTGEKGVAIGNEAVTTALSAIAIGNKVNATKDTAISIGNESNATGTAAVAYGNKAQATADSTVAVGDQSKATGANATAVGTSSEATEDSALAAGNAASATGNAALALGKKASASGARSVAIGNADNDETATLASATQAIAVGNKAQAKSENSIAVGTNTASSAANAISIGTNVSNTGAAAVGIGVGITVEGYKSTAVGHDLQIRNTGSTNIGYKSAVDANQAVSVGARNSVDANAQYGTAVGYFTRVTAKNAVAIGSSNDNNGNSDEGKVLASAESAVAIGTSAHAEAASAVAIGTKAKAQLAHSVALGEGSTTTAADGNATTGYLTNDAVNNTGNGIISVGNGGTILRRITSVASGTNDTDAVNVKQLKALRNASLSTVTVVNGASTTDLVPKTTEGDAEAHKVKLVAGNNITLTANGNAVTIASKSEVNTIESGNKDAISVTNTNGKVSVTPNLASDVNATDDANKLVTAGKVKEALADKVSTAKLNEELGKKANAADVTNLTNNKLDKTAELHVKKGSYAVNSDGSVTLDKADGTGAVKTEEAVTITGIASKTALEHLKTEVDKKASKDDLDTKIGEVNAELATKVSNDTFRDEMAKKADLKAINDLKDVLSGKVDAAALDKMVTALGNKVDETELNERLKTEKAENAAALKKAVDEAKAAANTGVNDLKEGKLDKTAELHVVKGEYEVDGDGTVTLKKANGENTEIADENVTIKGVASKAKLDEVAGKVTAAEGDITKLKAGVEENKNGLGDLKTKVDTVEGTANKAKEDLAGLTTKVDGIDGKVTAQGEKIAAADEKIAAIEKNITDNVVTNDSMAGKLEALKTDLGANTTLSFAGDTTIDDKGTDAADDDDNSATKLSLNLKEKTLKVKGATDEIKTEAKGDTITVGLSDKVKKELANISKLGDTAADGRDGKGATGKSADDPDATAADKGLTGQDGLNGKSLTDKVNALRNGEAGSVVYTDDKGNRLVKTNDGKYYKADQVDKDGNKIGSAKPVDSDKLQASVMNPDGKGGPTTLSNLKDGKIAENSKDAVTGNQLHAAKAEVAKYLGGGATVDENGNVTEPTFTVKDKDGKNVDAHNVGDALSTMNERLNNSNAAAAADIKQLKDMEGLSDKGKNAIKDIAKDAIDIKGDNHITFTSTIEDGKKVFHAKLDEKITLGGTADDGDHGDDPGVKLDGHEGYVSAGKGPNEVKMNGANGTITAGDTNGDKFVKINGADGSVQANKVTAGKGDKALSLDGDKGTITAGKGANAVAVDGTKALITAGTGENQVGINGKDGSVTAKTVKAKDGVFNKVTAGKDDKAVSLDGDKGTITAGTGANAVSVDGTKALITAGTGENQVGINGKDGSVTAKTVNAKDVNANTLTLGDKDSPEAVKMDGTKGTITTGKDAKAIEVNGPEGTITLGKKDGDTKVELNAEKGSVTANMGTFGAPADDKGVPTKEGVNTTTITDKGLSVVSKNADGTVSKVEIKDGKITGLNGSEYNNYKKDEKGNVVKDKDGKPVVDSSVKMDGAGLSIAPSTGYPTKSVSLTKDGLNNGGNRITNVAPGVEDTDAVTVGQMKEVTGKIGNALEKTAQRVDEVGAHSAALAALNPLSYDPLRKSQIMAGVGSYSGNQALALGLAHYANENFMVTAGFTMGSGKTMANVGATYRFGTSDDSIPERYKGGPISSVYVMQDEIAALKAENAKKDAENAEMKAQIKMLMQRMGMA